MSSAAREPFPQEDAEPPARWSLARGAWLILPFVASWFLLAFLSPSPVGVFVAAIPILGLLLAIAALLWSWALLKTGRRWSLTLRNTAIVGLSAGLALSGTLAAVGFTIGCPSLSPFTTSEPMGWSKLSSPPWKVNGHPVLLFFGSVACPFCSASSWAIWKAMQAFGQVNNTTFATSSPQDVDPNTPEVVLSGASLSSPYVAWDAREATNPTEIVTPPLGSCTELGYVAAYSGGTIPFVAVGGMFVKDGTLVDPAQLAGLTPAQVSAQVENASGPVWSGAIAPATYLLEAFLIRATGGLPVSVAADPPVAADLAEIR